MKPLLAIALVATLLFAGCAGPSVKPKGAETGLTVEQLKAKHLTVICNFKLDGTEGFHASLVDCDSGKLEDGKLDESEAKYEDPDQATSWFWNRRGTITTTVYYPGNHGNSAPMSINVGVEKDETSTFKATFKWSTASGFGAYLLDFQFENQNDNNPWWLPYSPKPDPGHSTSEFKLTKQGWF
ncbi:MAG: hypothetical protein AABX89_07395 [Candidatus Thermoplasmatota archaeon]